MAPDDDLNHKMVKILTNSLVASALDNQTMNEAARARDVSKSTYPFSDVFFFF